MGKSHCRTHLSVTYWHVELIPEDLDLPTVLLLLARMQLTIFLETQTAGVQ